MLLEPLIEEEFLNKKLDFIDIHFIMLTSAKILVKRDSSDVRK